MSPARYNQSCKYNSRRPFVCIFLFTRLGAYSLEKKLLHARNIHPFLLYMHLSRNCLIIAWKSKIYLRCVELNVSFKIVDFRHFLFRGAAQSRAKSFSPNGPLLGRFVIPRQDRFLLLSARFVNSAFHRVYSCNSSSSSRSNAHMCVHFTFFYLFV